MVPQLKRDLGTFFDMKLVKDGASKAGYSKMNEERVGLKRKVIVHVTSSDIDPKGIAMMFNQDEDVCGVRDCDKVGKSSVGDIVRTKNNVQCFLTIETFKFCVNSNTQIIFFACKMVINPFLEAQDLLNEAHTVGTF